MCVSAPKVPKIESVPERQAARLPDNGDPTVRAAQRRRRMVTQAMTLPNLGLPSVSGPSTLGVG